MSADSHVAAVPHHTAHGDEIGHGSLKGYVTGFGLSVVLTAIPFWIVMAGIFNTPLSIAIVLSLGVVQIFVHMIYFLHMNTKSEGGWTVLALIFTLVLVMIALTGSLWIMFHLNANMMPMSVHDAQQLP